ncbi:MAG: flagellin [Gemmatimonadota bacterium]|nr:flagellin [Gemmatimonadota bacterium]
MRVTNSIITRNSQTRLQTQLQGLDRVRDDISSGVRIRKMSDNPTNGGELVRIGSSMRALAQFQRNVDRGMARAAAEENVLNQLTNTLTRGIELGIGQASATGNAQSRLIVKAEVDQLINFAANLGNTRLGDEYLFGGHRAGEAPFQTPPPATGSFSRLLVAGNPVNPSGTITLEVGDNDFVTPTHNGTEVFLDTDALESLRALSTALGNNDPVAIQAAADRITTANNGVQSLIGTQGARINELETANANLEAVELNLKTFRADLRDTEVDKAMVELVGKQTLYQAAMSATSRILGLSLANYL